MYYKSYDLVTMKFAVCFVFIIHRTCAAFVMSETKAGYDSSVAGTGTQIKHCN